MYNVNCYSKRGKHPIHWDFYDCWGNTFSSAFHYSNIPVLWTRVLFSTYAYYIKKNTHTLSSCHHTPWRVTGCHSCLKVVCVSLSACRSIGGRMALFILVWCHVLWFDLSVNPPVSWCTSSYSILSNMLSSQCDSLWIRNFLSQLIACFPQPAGIHA